MDLLPGAKSKASLYEDFGNGDPLNIIRLQELGDASHLAGPRLFLKWAHIQDPLRMRLGNDLPHHKRFLLSPCKGCSPKKLTA